MNITALAATIADLWASYSQPTILTLGAVALTLGVFIAIRWYRHGESHQRTGTLAVITATAFTAEGMWEVVRQALNLPLPTAIVLFAMFEIVMVNQAQTARYKLGLPTPGNARRHMTFVWLLAAASGVIASLNSDNTVEFVLRLTAPFVAAGIWWMALTADGAVRSPDPISWRITPRRVLVFLRLADPGERDVIEVDRDRQVETIANLWFRLWRGASNPERLQRKLDALLLTADEAVVDLATVKVRRVIDRRAGFGRDGADTPAVAAGGTPPAPAPTGTAEPFGDTPTAPRHPASTPANGTGPGTPAPWGSEPLAPTHHDTLVGVPANGSGTPPRRPDSTPTGHGSAKGAAPSLTSHGTPAGTPCGTPDKDPANTPGRDGADTPAEYPADGVLLTVLRDPARVPRETDGTVPVKRAMRVLKIGRDRAIRILKTAGLLREPLDDTPDDDTPGTPAETPGSTPAKTVNGSTEHPDLAGVTS